MNDRDYKSHYHRYYTEPGKGRIGKGAEDRPCPVVIVLEIVEDWSYVEDPLIPYRRIRMLRNESRVVIEHVFLIVCDNIKVFPAEIHTRECHPPGKPVREIAQIIDKRRYYYKKQYTP